MTRILWNLCPSYWGLSQLMTILKDLPLAAVNANSKMLKSSERANGPSSSRDLLFRVVEAKGTSPAIVRGQSGFAQAGFFGDAACDNACGAKFQLRSGPIADAASKPSLKNSLRSIGMEIASLAGLTSLI